MHGPVKFLMRRVIILAGFLGSLIFERIRFPDVLLLLGIGIALAPGPHLIEASSLAQFAAFFGSLALMTFPALNSTYAFMIGVLLLLVFLARNLGVIVTGYLFHEKREERFIMLSMLPRGLASAVLGTIPVAAGLPGTDRVVHYVFAIVVETNIFMTVGVVAVERLRGEQPDAETVNAVSM